MQGKDFVFTSEERSLSARLHWSSISLILPDCLLKVYNFYSKNLPNNYDSYLDI